MNESFDKMIEVQTINHTSKKGKELSYYNLIDVGVITSVVNGRCNVQSYRMFDDRNIVYYDLELIYPGGIGSFNPEGMTCVVLFPPETTDLDKKTISTVKPFFSAFGGKVIPVTTYGDNITTLGPAPDGSFYVDNDLMKLRLSENQISLTVSDTLTIRGDAASIILTMNKGNIIYFLDNLTGNKIEVLLNNGTPFYYRFISKTEEWVGHTGYKAMTDNSIKNDITKYVKTDFNFVEDYLATERWLYIYKNDGSILASLCVDNTGEILVETAEDITVDRDGTKLEVKNGKVVVTGDLEVSGKTTITGMKTDVQNFFDGLTSALNSMFTIGSPATHQTDGGFKSNIAQLRSKL